MAGVKYPVEAWARRYREPEKAYEAFLVYKNTGPGRSFAETARRLQKSHSLINRWATAWDWKARVLEWDRDIERKAKEEAQREHAKMIERHIKIGMKVQEKGLEGLKNLKPEKMGAISVQSLLDFGTKLERETRAFTMQDAAASEQDAASILASVLEKAWGEKERTEDDGEP